jgi:hypothetical protein
MGTLEGVMAAVMATRGATLPPARGTPEAVTTPV